MAFTCAAHTGLALGICAIDKAGILGIEPIVGGGVLVFMQMHDARVLSLRAGGHRLIDFYLYQICAAGLTAKGASLVLDIRHHIDVSAQTALPSAWLVAIVL